MITINVMLLFKIVSLICIGTIMLFYILATFSTENLNFISIFIAFLFMAIPFIYILFN